MSALGLQLFDLLFLNLFLKQHGKSNGNDLSQFLGSDRVAAVAAVLNKGRRVWVPEVRISQPDA